MHQYLESTEYIDWKTPEVLTKAKSLAAGADCPELVAEKCFVFVRDQIKHSGDYECSPVTCKASDVLEHGTGYCYAKSHLLAALLRANGIPAGLCYQRLTISDDGDGPPFCLHGLNAIYLEEHGWYRVDARGNKPGVVAGFCPPTERLAFPIVTEGEADFSEIWSEPITPVLDVLLSKNTYREVADNLPDIDRVIANKTIHSTSV
ncbi:MAG: transglutaminase family protein [Pseudomonadales bacterium]|nr:transglutaminase family protein [Pseudomonadales bacterium]